MSTPPTSKPVPILLPTDLLDQINDLAADTGLSKQDTMRLCMRIGAIDLRSAEANIPGIVKHVADDKGLSFEAFAKSHLNHIPERREVKYTTGKQPLNQVAETED